jgi:hypothetical protein
LYRGDIFLTCTPPGCDKLTADGDCSAYRAADGAVQPVAAVAPDRGARGVTTHVDACAATTGVQCRPSVSLLLSHPVCVSILR